jgi:hypothetical protein
MLKIFKLLDKNPNETLKVEDFVTSYVSYEEQLKIKVIKIEKFLDDLTEDKKRIEEEKRQAELNEQELENGLTNKSNLFITIIEGKDLDDGELMAQCNPFVQITFQGNTQKSLVKQNTYNPAWNENFKFEINSYEGVAQIEVLNETFLGNKSIGYVNISLDDLKNQEEKISWFDLNTGRGKIRMKILCILNLVSFHEKQLNKTTSELKNFKKIYDELKLYEAQTDTPFGIIYVQNLDPLLNKENIKKTENIIDLTRDSKRNVYASGSFDNDNLKKNFQIKKVKWNRATQFLMMILILLTFFTLLERSDFLNLFLSIIIMVLFFLDKNSDIDKYLQPLILTIGGTLIYDFIWFISQFGSFMADGNNPEIGLKRLIYIISLINFAIKALLISGLNDIKKKKLNQKYQVEQ